MYEENTLALSEVPSYVEKSANGKKITRQTVYNWAKGIRGSGEKLRTATGTNGVIFTKKEWVDDFLARM